MVTNTLTDAELVAQVRERLGYSVRTLAPEMGVGWRQVSKWLAGDARLRPAMRAKLERMLAEAE